MKYLLYAVASLVLLAGCRAPTGSGKTSAQADAAPQIDASAVEKVKVLHDPIPGNCMKLNYKLAGSGRHDDVTVKGMYAPVAVSGGGNALYVDANGSKFTVTIYRCP